MRLLQIFAYGSVLSTYVLIVIGAVVRSTNSGDACPDWPTCHGQLVPELAGPVLIEYTHRVFTLVVTGFVALTALLVWLRYRSNKGVLMFSTASLLALVAQIFVGMVTVNTSLDPAVVTTHLAVATAVFGFTIINGILARNLEAPPSRIERGASIRS